MLNSCNKLSAKVSLTDLEKVVIDALRNNGFSDDDIKQYSRLYPDIPELTRREMFPNKFVRISTQTQYDLKQLQADLPKIQELAVSNLRNLESRVQALYAQA
jgi:DNA-binding transcriptional MerR regulator